MTFSTPHPSRMDLLWLLGGLSLSMLTPRNPCNLWCAAWSCGDERTILLEFGVRLLRLGRKTVVTCVGWYVACFFSPDGFVVFLIFFYIDWLRLSWAIVFSFCFFAIPRNTEARSCLFRESGQQAKSVWKEKGKWSLIYILGRTLFVLERNIYTPGTPYT